MDERVEGGGLCSQSHYCRRFGTLWSLCMTLLLRLHVGVVLIRLATFFLDISSSSTFSNRSSTQRSHLIVIKGAETCEVARGVRMRRLRWTKGGCALCRIIAAALEASGISAWRSSYVCTWESPYSEQQCKS